MNTAPVYATVIHKEYKCTPWGESITCVTVLSLLIFVFNCYYLATRAATRRRVWRIYVQLWKADAVMQVGFCG